MSHAFNAVFVVFHLKNKLVILVTIFFDGLLWSFLVSYGIFNFFGLLLVFSDSLLVFFVF